MLSPHEGAVLDCNPALRLCVVALRRARRCRSVGELVRAPAVPGTARRVPFGRQRHAAQILRAS